MKRLVVQPFGGLCNRLRAVVSAGLLAESLGRVLEVDWINDASTCGCSPEDLFLVFPPLSRQPPGAPFHAARNLGDVRLALTAAGPLDVRLRMQGELRPDGMDPATYEARFREALRALQPQARILEQVPALPPGTIGLHVRRGDHWPATRYSPLYLFRDALDGSGSTPAYLATDSAAVVTALARRHSARLPWLRARTLTRSSALGMGEALVDLIALSRTARIFGSVSSSFSVLASRLGGVPLHTLALPDAPATFSGDTLDRMHFRLLRHDPVTGQWSPREPAGWRGRLLGPVRRPLARALARRAAHVLSDAYQDVPPSGG